MRLLKKTNCVFILQNDIVLKISSWVLSAIWFLVTEYILKSCSKGSVTGIYDYIHNNYLIL